VPTFTCVGDSLRDSPPRETEKLQILKRRWEICGSNVLLAPANGLSATNSVRRFERRTQYNIQPPGLQHEKETCQISLSPCLASHDQNKPFPPVFYPRDVASAFTAEEFSLSFSLPEPDSFLILSHSEIFHKGKPVASSKSLFIPVPSKTSNLNSHAKITVPGARWPP
jgi:hypothetical protein